MNRLTSRRPLRPWLIVTYLVLALWALTTVYPFVWVILNSFREKGLIRRDSFSIPTAANGFTLDNYRLATERFHFGSAYLNSLLISLSVTAVVVVLSGLAAYGLVRYRFRGRGLLYSLIMDRPTARRSSSQILILPTLPFKHKKSDTFLYLTEMGARTGNLHVSLVLSGKPGASAPACSEKP